MAVIWNTFCKNASFKLKKSNQYFLIVIISTSGTYNLFWASVINYYYTNELHLFWESFELFCLQISRDAKYFSSLVQSIVIED